MFMAVRVGLSDDMSCEPGQVRKEAAATVIMGVRIRRI